MMRRNQTLRPQNSTVILIIGAVAVAVIILALGFLLGMGLTRQSEKPTALPEGFAQTAIAMTLAAQPTESPLPSATYTPTDTPTPTYTPTPTPTNTKVYVAWYPSATEYITLPDGTMIPATYAPSPVATYISVVCGCEVEKVTCFDFRLPSQAQQCYDSCRAQLCTDEATYESCDPWGLDASDGSLDSEHWVCGFNDSRAPAGYP